MSLYIENADVLEWMTLPTPSFRQRCDGAAALVRTKEGDSAIGVLVVGGRSVDNGEAVSTVEMLEWQLMKWWKIPSLNTPRFGSATATLQDNVFVIGGTHPNAPQALDSAEQWTLGDTAWENLPERMSTPRWFCAAVGMPKQSKVIVVGGRDATWQVLKTVESYDVPRKTWSTCASMNTPRFGCAVVAIGATRIMVMGGYDGTKYLDSCQAYDVVEDEWFDMAPMPVAVAFCSATTVSRDSRFVFVVGRRQENDEEDEQSEDNGATEFSHANKIVQCYSVESRKWKVLTTSEMLEPGAIMAIGEDLFCIGKPRPSKTTEHDHNLIICRGAKWSDVNFQRLWDERSVSSEDADGWRHKSHFSSGDIGDFSRHSQSSLHHRADSMGSIPTAHSMPTIDAVVIPTAELISERNIRAESVSSQASNTASIDRREIKQVSNLFVQDTAGKAARYTGEISARSDKPHGKGCMRWDVTGEVYDGGWFEGQRHGLGLTTFANGDFHEGNYAKDKKNGPGTFRWKDGRTYQGVYVNDNREDDHGMLTWRDGTKYVGKFVRSQRQGPGRMEFPDGVWYEGEFAHGKYEGFGTCRFRDGKIYKGQWKASKADGEGVLTDADGKVLHQGKWERDAPVVDR